MHKLNRVHINNVARKLQLQLWADREKLLGKKSCNPLDLLEPSLAASFLGLKYEMPERIQNPGFGTHGRIEEYAGQMDRDRKLIAVANRFPQEIKRFTGAHEIGHFLLHKGLVHHRDLPINGTNVDKNASIEEQEASHFSACFLMPKKQIELAVEYRFNIKLPLILNETLAFQLNPSEYELILREGNDSLLPFLSLASFRGIGGKSNRTLTNQFRVSGQAMAIRLKELKIITF